MSNTPENQRNISVIQPNAVTNARYDYTKIEKNIIYQVIYAMQDKMANAFIAPDLFSNHLAIEIPYNRLKLWDTNNNLSRELKKAVSSLRKKDYEIKGDTSKWVDTGFVVYAEYFEGQKLYVEISKALLPALMQLSNNFTAYNAVVAMSLKSKYSQRFYEWCCRWRDTGWFEFTPDELNDILVSKMSTGALKERVITPACEELQELFSLSQSDVCFTVEEERGGKGRGGSVKKWRFHVKNRIKKEALKEASNEDLIYIIDYLKKAWPGKTDLVKKATDKIITSNCVIKLAERLEKVKTREIDNLGGWMRTVLKDEFNIQV